MPFAKRLDLLARLRDYMRGSDLHWEAAKDKAYRHNGWFLPSFIDLAVGHIVAFLEPSRLQQWMHEYRIPEQQASPKTIGIVMPGNIPLEGFHDFVCAFLAGHRQRIRLSAKDEILLKHLVEGPLSAWDPGIAGQITFESMLKGCDAYLATGNMAQGPLAHYFDKYPSIIRPLRRQAAILHGNESPGDLELLADDVFQYFGVGCLNVNKLYVPRQYDFIPLLKAFEKYSSMADISKYMNNYDYQLSLLILNKEFYMTNGCILLTESAAATSPIGRLNYEYYDDERTVLEKHSVPAGGNKLTGKGYTPFGRAGQSVLCGDIPGRDTLQFLLDL